MEYLILAALYFIPLLILRYLILKTAENEEQADATCMAFCFIPALNIIMCFFGLFILAKQTKFWDKVASLFFYGRITPKE